MKKIGIYVLGPHVAGRLGQMHGCRLAKYRQIKIFDSFKFEMPNIFGSNLCKNLQRTKIGIVIFGLLA